MSSMFSHSKSTSFFDKLHEKYFVRLDEVIGGVRPSSKPNLRHFSPKTLLSLEVALRTFNGGYLPLVKPNLCLSHIIERVRFG